MNIVGKALNFSATTLVVLSLSMGTAYSANANANGNGKSGNAGNSGNSNAGGQGNGGNEKLNGGNSNAEKQNSGDGNDVSSLGKLNGFFHASDKALAKASEDSAIGKVSVVYAGLLNQYLLSGGTQPTAAEVANALESAANKPLSPDIVAAVNARLLLTDANLTTNLGVKPIADLNQEISTALGVY